MTEKPPIIVTRYVTPEMSDELERSDEPHAHARLIAFRQAVAEHGPDVRVRFCPPPSRWKCIVAALKEGFTNG